MKKSYLMTFMTGCILLTLAITGVIVITLKGRSASGKEAFSGEEAAQEEEKETGQEEEKGTGREEEKGTAREEEKETAQSGKKPWEAIESMIGGSTWNPEPSQWLAAYTEWLEAYGEDVKISLVSIDDDAVPECLVWLDKEWDSVLYILSCHESGITEYQIEARDICFECEERSGRFACMMYSGLGTGWEMVELTASGFAKAGEAYAGQNPENWEMVYSIDTGEVDYVTYLQYIAGFTGNIEIGNVGLSNDDKDRIWSSAASYGEGLETAYARWSIGGFRENEKYWETVQ